jgi:hypothetical protein
MAFICCAQKKRLTLSHYIDSHIDMNVTSLACLSSERAQMKRSQKKNSDPLHRSHSARKKKESAIQRQG